MSRNANMGGVTIACLGLVLSFYGGGRGSDVWTEKIKKAARQEKLAIKQKANLKGYLVIFLYLLTV